MRFTKRLLRSTALLLVIVVACFSAASAWGDTVVTIRAPKTASVGDIITVSVEVPQNTGYIAIQFCILYDVEKLELKSATAGSALKTVSGGQSFIDSSSMVTYFLWDTLTGSLTAGGSILDMTFEVLEGAEGVTSIRMDDSSDLLFCTEGYIPEDVSPAYAEIHLSGDEPITVDITWPALSFEFAEQEWDPTAHEYIGGRWKAVSPGGDTINIANNSETKAVSAAVGFEAAASGISGEVSGPETIATGDSGEYTLALTGTPQNPMVNVELGVVTITIQEAAE